MFGWFVAVASAVEVEAVVVDELHRAQEALGALGEPLHYAAVVVQDHEGAEVVAVDGALSSRDTTRDRWLDVDLRYGTPELDSTHTLRGDSAWDGDGRWRWVLAWDGPGEEAALRRAIVVDPVMRAESGARLLDADAVRLVRERLLPLATVATRFARPS